MPKASPPGPAPVAPPKADCDTWDKAMRELAAKNLTELANNWLSQDKENPRNPETDPITED